VVSFTPLPLYPWGKSPRYLLDRRLAGPQNKTQEKTGVLRVNIPQSWAPAKGRGAKHITLLDFLKRKSKLKKDGNASSINTKTVFDLFF
jgi:hypothetical protein